MNKNIHQPHNCPYCWLVLYSKGALTNHMNHEHWEDMEAEEKAVAEEVEVSN